MFRSFGAAAAVSFLALSFSPSSSSAQGVTSAAVRGKVTDDAGASVEGAVVSLQNGSTGQRFETRTRAAGIYNFENVAVGGPYTLEARSIGYRPVSQTEITLSLGQAIVLDLKLTRAAVQLAEITVTGAELQNPLLTSSHAGA